MWINAQTRRPTEDDANSDGMVLWRYDSGSVDVYRWNYVGSALVAWQPIEPYTPLPEIPAGYRLLMPEEYNQKQKKAAMYLSSDGGWRYITEAGRCYQPPDTYIVPVEKTYRPFTADDFKPHRERWWRPKIRPTHYAPPLGYNEHGYGVRSWQLAFEELEFEDGSPFGVEVVE